MERVNLSMKCAGVDVGKRCLDVAVHGGQERLEVANSERGLGELIAWTRAQGVSRVGMDAPAATSGSPGRRWKRPASKLFCISPWR